MGQDWEAEVSTQGWGQEKEEVRGGAQGESGGKGVPIIAPAGGAASLWLGPRKVSLWVPPQLPGPLGHRLAQLWANSTAGHEQSSLPRSWEAWAPALLRGPTAPPRPHFLLLTRSQWPCPGRRGPPGPPIPKGFKSRPVTGASGARPLCGCLPPHPCPRLCHSDNPKPSTDSQGYRRTDPAPKNSHTGDRASCLKAHCSAGARPGGCRGWSPKWALKGEC